MQILTVTSLSELPAIVREKNIQGIVFDAFGTLVRLKQPSNPYGIALRALGQHYSYNDDLRTACMTTQNDFEGFLKGLDVAKKISSKQWDEWQRLLEKEVQTLAAYDESEAVLESLAQVKKVVCSNLATPYAEALDGMNLLVGIPKVWSCTHGKTKPSSELFDISAKTLGLNADRVWMVGDSWASDMLGAKNAGFGGGVFVRRNAKKRVSEESLSNQDPVA